MDKLMFRATLDSGATFEMSIEEEYLPTILVYFEQFLLGCGFVLKGHITIEERE